MPIAEDEVGHRPNDEKVEAEERRQSVGVIDEKNEEMQERQQEEGGDTKYEEDTERLSDDRQEMNDSRAQDRKDKGEDEKHFGGQGESEPVWADDEEEKFEEAEEEVHQLEDGHQSEEHIVNQEIKENAMESFGVSDKLLEGGLRAAEGFEDQEDKIEHEQEIQSKDEYTLFEDQEEEFAHAGEIQLKDDHPLFEAQEEKFEPAEEILLKDDHPLGSELEIADKIDGEEHGNHMSGMPKGAVDHGEGDVLIMPLLKYAHSLENMHESENVEQDRMDNGEEKDEQLEQKKEPSEAASDHNEAALRGASLSHPCEAPDTHAPADQFVDTAGEKAISIQTEISSIRPMEIEESTIKEELAVEEAAAVSTESGKEHLEGEEHGADKNVDKGKSEDQEWEEAKSGEEVQDEVEQEETKIAMATNVDNDINETLRGMEALVPLVDGHLPNQEIRNASKEATFEETQYKNDEENTRFHDKIDKPRVSFEEMGVQANKNSKLSLNNDDELVVDEAILLDTEEKVVTGENGRLKDQIQLGDSMTDTDGREKKPMSDEAEVNSTGDETEEDEEEKDTVYSLTATAAANAGSNNTSTSSSGLHLPARPAGLGASAPLQESASRAVQHFRANGTSASHTFQLVEDQSTEDNENNETREKPDGREKNAMADEPEVDSTGDETEEDEEEDTGYSLTATAAANAGSNNTSTSSSGLHLPARPAGLGVSASLLEPASRAVQQSRANGTSASHTSQLVEDQSTEDDENNETREKLQMIRVKFLRLAHRLGQTPHNVVVAQVLYRLGLAEQLRGSRNSSRTGAFSFDRASAIAEQQEAAGQEGLDFTCTIMVLGKTGVGKSATINSIFDEVKSRTNAFGLGTKKAQEIVGTVQGINIRVIDTPGLLSSFYDQRHNEKVLKSVKCFIKKTPPDIILYFDRMDMQSRDYGDLPLLRTVTETFGSLIWFNAIVVLTHAASAPPDGPNGTPLSYEMFVTQRSNVVQQAIRQAAGDMRLMNPVSLVENHSACRTNMSGQRVLPNGQIWKPQLLLLCFASKILAEANALLKLQDSTPGRLFGSRPKLPPLPFLLSSLLQSKPQLKLPEEQLGDEDASDEDLDEVSDTEDESEYDKLPPFRCLRKSQLNKLSKEQRKAYYDELEYREKLFLKKQLKEERQRRRFMKKMAGTAKEEAEEYDRNMEEDYAGPTSVPVPMPDMALPPSFDADNPTHRYRYLDTSSQWFVRPVLETHGWDHDVGYEGLNLEKMFVIHNKIPVSISGQVTKDKKEANLQMECAGNLKHGEGKMTSVGLDIQTVSKELVSTLRTETMFSNFKHNKTTAGLEITLLGNAIAGGIKLEDRLTIGKRFKMVLNGGAIMGHGDATYGGSLEATLRDKDHPIGRSLSTLGLSIMDWHGDLAIGCNLQSQFAVGRNSTMIARANLNNRGSGQVGIRISSSEQLQIALIGIIPIFRTLGNRFFVSSNPM